MTGLVLHNFFRSSASVRLRVALNLKGLSYDYAAYRLRKNEHRQAEFLARNPQGLVPALELADGSVLTQSLAIMEYLDETHPQPPLLGSKRPRTRCSLRHPPRPRVSDFKFQPPICRASYGPSCASSGPSAFPEPEKCARFPASAEPAER